LKTAFTEKQIQIIQVAETLFAQKGFDGTSIRDIAKEAKINIAMISYYFGSKEQLLESLIIYRATDIKLQLDTLVLEDLNPLEKINNLI
jgi:AcrR family transcriptional regulator